jgi:hypothetical protein
MSSRSKFKDLDRYFGSVKTNEITLTLGEIERIIGQKLCDSAYKYPAYWYDSKTHMLPKCWAQNMRQQLSQYHFSLCRLLLQDPLILRIQSYP